MKLYVWLDCGSSMNIFICWILEIMNLKNILLFGDEWEN